MSTASMHHYTGIAASPGIAIGPAVIHHRETPAVERHPIDDADAEIARLGDAIDAVDAQLRELEQRTREHIGVDEAEIFGVHRLFLIDPSFIDEIRTKIHAQSLNAEAAVDSVTRQLVSEFTAIRDDYFAQRANDVRDVSERLLRQLLGLPQDGPARSDEPAILIAHDLAPSDAAKLDREHVLGIATTAGSRTSHTAILARSLGVPAVVGLGDFAVAAGTPLALDGDTGQIITNPDESTRTQFFQRRDEQKRQRALAVARAHEPATTADGQRVEVVANIGSVAEAQAALEWGAEGVGLLRTEFLFLQRETLPDEDEHYAIYRAIADVFGERPLVVRTLDVGGDKNLPAFDLPPENNPFLGQRAIRLSLAQPDIFRTQLRALLRAGVDRNLKIMFPLISAVDELRAALGELSRARDELRAAGRNFAERIEIGVMVEVPSAALVADGLAPLVDFFSIGTNDLASYTLAVDRTNERVAHLADPLHPAVVRLIARVIEVAHAHGKWVGLCGELAGRPIAAPLLLGLGLDEFSMNAPAIPTLKATLRQWSQDQAREVAEHCLSLTEVGAVREYLSNAAQQR